jgi:hypothetical protein
MATLAYTLLPLAALGVLAAITRWRIRGDGRPEPGHADAVAQRAGPPPSAPEEIVDASIILLTTLDVAPHRPPQRS